MSGMIRKIRKPDYDKICKGCVVKDYMLCYTCDGGHHWRGVRRPVAVHIRDQLGSAPRLAKRIEKYQRQIEGSYEYD